MIEIDLGSLVPGDLLARLSPAVQQVVLHDIADMARAKWVQVAMSDLHSTQQDYVAGISPVSSADGIAWITLKGKLANMTEQGYSAFNMRETMLKEGQRGVHLSADGHRYRYVFFRRGSEGVTGRNFKSTNDLWAAQLGAERSKRIGNRAMHRVRKLAPTVSNPGGPTHWGESLPADLTPKLRKGDLSPAGHPLTADHKTDLMAGAYYFEQTYEGKPQHFAGVFRTISTKEKDGWIHPGYRPGIGANLREKVNEYIGRVAPAMLANLGADLK